MMESRLSFLLVLVATMVTLSDQRVTPPPDACAGMSSSGREYYPIQGRCDRFYRCSENGPSAAIQCRLGTFFSSSKQTCDYPKNVMQDQLCGLCSGRNVHPYMGSCEVYYECTGNADSPVEAKCCPVGQTFVEDVGCQPLGFGQTCGASNYTHSMYCRNYLQCVDGTLTQFCCPRNERFDGERCVSDPDGQCGRPCEGEEFTTAVPPPTPRASTECKPGIDSELNNIQQWGMMDLNGAWLENKGVVQSSDRQSGVFRNGAYITLSFFNNNVMPPFRATVRFQPGTSTSNVQQDLLSNACVEADNFITLSVIPASRTVSVSVNGASASVNWNPSLNNDPWVEATVEFANQNLKVSARNGESQSVEDNVPFSGSVTNNCKLTLGQSFDGLIDRVTAWKCLG